MPEAKKPKEGTAAQEAQERGSENFRFVLKALLNAYQPVLEEDLRRAQSPDKLVEEAEANPPNCDDELALANRIFEKFFTEEVALRLLPQQALELLGPIERWRWCFLKIRCCIILGWLLCRRHCSFRTFVYYLYRYWLCVRQAVGAPVGTTPTPEQRQDFQTLVTLLAGAVKPHLLDQLATVEFPQGLPDEVLSGKIDCFEGGEDFAALLERFHSVDTARALLGAEAFAIHSQQPYFWFCRCWCLCAIRFGCCLAHAKNLVEMVHCLRAYRRCLRECFRPLECGITDPNGCVEEHIVQTPNTIFFRGIEIQGTAAGAFCSHYTLQWREAGTATWRSDGIHYAGSPEPPQGQCGVINGILGYLETYPSVPPGPVEIQLCVHSTQPGVAPQCCFVTFELQRNLVWIRGIEGIEAAEPPGVSDPTAQLTDGTGEVRSFGTAVEVKGTAWVGGCENHEIRRYTLSYHPGFVNDPLLPGFVQFWQVDFINAFQQAYAQGNPINERELTSEWRRQRICLPPCFTIGNFLNEARWSTQVPRSYRVEPVDPPGTPNPPIWNSTPLPLLNCQSGRYTLRLTVEDNAGNIKHDLQQAWFDNKPLYGRILGIQGTGVCETLFLKKFAVEEGDCRVAWPASLLGIAFDELIDETLPSTCPNDNFDYYRVWIKKDGEPWFRIPIPGPGMPPWGPPFEGHSRVGDPGTRGIGYPPQECAECPVLPPGPFPLEAPGILAILDMRRLDAECNPNEPRLTLRRGECCGYTIRLQVRDKTIAPECAHNVHVVDDFFALCVCNDLPRIG